MFDYHLKLGYTFFPGVTKKGNVKQKGRNTNKQPNVYKDMDMNMLPCKKLSQKVTVFQQKKSGLGVLSVRVVSVSRQVQHLRK